jgi:hypothetical protein
MAQGEGREMSLFAQNPYAIGIQPVAGFCHFCRLFSSPEDGEEGLIREGAVRFHCASPAA